MPRPDRLPDPASFGAPSPRAALPLQGLTVLAVEDSRYASDALRLMCQRSGARFRRAESLAAAAAHLRLYRPDVVIVDLGLPDGPGTGLIRQLAPLRSLVVLGCSGDPDRAEAAAEAGAAGFLEKPVPGLEAFQALILSHLPDARLRGPAMAGEVAADPLALHDDLRTAGRALAAAPAGEERAWLAGFLAGLARQSQDSALAVASDALRDPSGSGTLPALAGLLRDRIAQGPAAFGRGG